MMNGGVGARTDKPFLDVMDTVKATGLSQHFLRSGIRNGTVPHIKSGNKYYINVPMLIEQLNQQSAGKMV